MSRRSRKRKKYDEHLDLKEGGKLLCKDGSVLKLKPHSERVFLSYWEGNGACMEVLAYAEKLKGIVDSDRIHLIIRDSKGKKKGWIMNIEDAEYVIEGLVIAMRLTGSRGVPRSG